MNERHQRIAGYVASCSGVLGGSFAGALVGGVATSGGVFGGITPALLVFGACVLVGAMLSCWLTLKSIQHPAANRTTMLLLVFLPMTGLALSTANLQRLGSVQVVYAVVAIALALAALVAHYIALRFQRYAR
jgi:hypothetical protein